MTTLAESYDALLLDLDGTVYLGGQPIDHVAPALARAKQQGARSVFVTNNASRPPAEVAASLAGMGVPAEPDDVLTSPQAAAVMLSDRHPAGHQGARRRCSLAGRIGDQRRPACRSGWPPTNRRPSSRGIRRTPAGVNWPRPASRSAPAPTGWPATSTAPCRPIAVCCPATAPWWPRWSPRPGCTPGWPANRSDRCSMPPSGSSTPSGRWWSATGWTPTSPVRWPPGRRACWSSPGVSTAADLLAAVPAQRPTYLAFDLRGLVEEDHAVRIPAATSTSSSLEWSVTPNADSLILASSQGSSGSGQAVSDASALRALAMLTARAWAPGVTAVHAQDPSAAAALDRCGLAAATP